jgi:DNA primase
MLTELPDIERTKRKNIIEMALGFTAMIRIFSEGSKAKIAAQLEDLFSSLGEIVTRDEYETRHRSFCEWFGREIWTAEKTLKNEKLQPSQPSSYGQAAKVLDIAIKVYVYYCAQPTAEIAQRIVPFLNGAVDAPIMKCLKKSKDAAATIRATTIKQVDETEYQALQAIVLAESHARKIHPVQYDDIMWRKLNREKNEQQENG